MEINVKSIDNSFKLDINGNTTIYEIKSMVREKDGIPEDQLRVIFAGKLLEDDKTAADYDIADDSTIHMVLRLRDH